jgi:hypothetical protein
LWANPADMPPFVTPCCTVLHHTIKLKSRRISNANINFMILSTMDETLPLGFKYCFYYATPAQSTRQNTHRFA